MIDLLKKNTGNVKFFVASNDYALIKCLEGICTYINLYEKHATSSEYFNIQNYTPK